MVTTLTIKRGTGLTRREWEWRIPDTLGLLLRALSTRRVVKHRYQVDRWELDIYERPQDLVTLEIELASIEEPVPTFPQGLEVVEVTGDSQFSNQALAKEGKWYE
jgi:CYTH domain-containing protein